MTIYRFFKRSAFTLAYIYRSFHEEGCAYRATALAYTTLLALVPLTIVAFTLLSFVPAFQGVGVRLQNLIWENFVPTSAGMVAAYLSQLTQNVTGLSIINIFFLGIVALLLMYNINRAFVAIWHTEHHFRLSLHFLIYFMVLLLSPFLLGAVMLLGTFLVQSPLVTDLIGWPYLGKGLLFVLPYVLIFITFTLFNWVLPSAKVKLSHAVIGGLVTTVLFELAKFAFTVYLKFFPTYRVIYGALSVIPIFLVWLYVSWTIILLGAVVSNVIACGIPEKYK
ncbi:YihY family inner membrane protein [Coxiella burnetii]|uniref:YihY family inner membrane protein n=2 Tax=Coxiella burnetii TaxID=777 RepID=UPI0002E8594B|nr:YihY family inner membrane protein [Coxiella burnetii]AML48521.1 hypothetical protein AUR58_04500 [Coxiella burnetii]ATN68480.1 hypothetical protein AYM00_04180 [Coxiella burnetii]ATN72341.1 hypothetical protein AYM11_03895 [Coxiella burnetii]AZV75142.1 YihY family inner membrane protein [Coxiella burnetii]KJY14191.1 membrane protein [Coxiella burnetii]